MSNQNIEQYLLKVQIFSTSRIDERSGVSEKTGKDWFIRTQEAYIELGGQFPVQIKVSGYFDLKVSDIVLVPAIDK